MATEQQICVKALQQLHDETNKYPNIVTSFNTWYVEGDWESVGLDDELYNCEMEASTFIDELREQNIVQNTEEAQLIFDRLRDALTNGGNDEIKEDEAPNGPAFNTDESLPVKILSLDIKDFYHDNVISSKSPLRKRFKEQAPDLLSADVGGCKDILKAYVLSKWITIYMESVLLYLTSTLIPRNISIKYMYNIQPSHFHL